MTHEKMTHEEYRNHHALGNSDLKLINDNLEHFEEARKTNKPQSAATKFGTDFHCFYLEPEEFKKKYILTPPDIKPGSSKAWKEYKEDMERKGLEILDPEDLVAFGIMKGKIDQLKLFRDGIAEKPLFGKIRAADTDIDVKCRPDYLTKEMIIDLKTAQSARKEEFDKSVRNYRYYVQAALYLEICRQHNPLVDKFIFVVVESSSPYSVAAYELDAGYLDAGKAQYMADLAKYVYDTRMNRKGYEPGVSMLVPPDWFMKQHFAK
jgi:exodeoxyribonuclease VIII